MGPKRDAVFKWSRFRKCRDFFDEVRELRGLDDPPSGNFGHFLKNLWACRLTDFFDLSALGQDDRFNRFVLCTGSGCADFPSTREINLEAAAESSPSSFVFLKLDALGAAVGRGQVNGNCPFLERCAVGVKGVRIERDGGPGFGPLGAEEKPNALTRGHVSLIGHPACDLAPETIMIEILHAAPPAPGGVDAHKKHLAAASCLGDEQWDRAEFPTAVAMHGEDFGAALGLDDRSVPVEAGKPPPDFRVFLLVVS